MARLAEGDRLAFDPLFRALYPRALRFARLKLSEDGAAEAAQNVLMLLFARASDFEAGRPVLPWFYAVAGNEIRRLQRANRTDSRVGSEDSEHVAAHGDPESLLLDRELRGSLDRAIAALDRDSASAILALLGDAPRPHVTPVAFRKRVSRAYARLRDFFGGERGQ